MTTSRIRSVFLPPKKGNFVVVDFASLSGTLLYVQAKTVADANALFEALLASPSVAGVSLFIAGKFCGSNDGAGS